MTTKRTGQVKYPYQDLPHKYPGDGREFIAPEHAPPLQLVDGADTLTHRIPYGSRESATDLGLLALGVQEWNRRREGRELDCRPHFYSLPQLWMNLNLADLRGLNLNGIDFTRMNLASTDLRGSSLIYARLTDTHIEFCDFTNAVLAGADLSITYCEETKFVNADLRRAILNASRVDLRGADLRSARIEISEAQISNAIMGYTILEDVDLKSLDGLEQVVHSGPSVLGTNTLRRAEGCAPESFLRGCGLSDWEILGAKLYDPNLSAAQIADIQADIFRARADSPIQISPIFISYSKADDQFVDRLEREFNVHGIRFWRDKHDLVAGRLETQLTRAIHLNEIILLVLSENSVKSDWVEFEAREAREKERQYGRDALCPIGLDMSWKTSRWSERLRMQIEDYNILDFSGWRDEAIFLRAFERLLKGLNLYYG